MRAMENNNSFLGVMQLVSYVCAPPMMSSSDCHIGRHLPVLNKKKALGLHVRSYLTYLLGKIFFERNMTKRLILQSQLTIA